MNKHNAYFVLKGIESNGLRHERVKYFQNENTPSSCLKKKIIVLANALKEFLIYRF